MGTVAYSEGPILTIEPPKSWFQTGVVVRLLHSRLPCSRRSSRVSEMAFEFGLSLFIEGLVKKDEQRSTKECLLN